MFQEYDMVKLNRDLPLDHLQAGTLGTILMVFDEPNLPRAYEVEFVSDNMTTLAVLTVEEKDLERV